MNHGYELYRIYDRLNLTGKVLRVGEYSIGQGGCSNVWEGFYDGRKVAVKVIREVDVSTSDRELTLKRRLVREVRAWSDLHHRNILPLLGFAYDFNLGCKLASLVSPWMLHGTANQFLKARSVADKLRILTNVADGLCYLHRYNVVHGDIKGDNILIDENLEPRLADFGLSRVVSESIGETMTHTQGFFGSVRWSARELFGSSEDFGAPGVTRESDIWAFGMTILELFTGLPPFFELKSNPQVIIAIHKGRLPEQPDPYCGFDDDTWALCNDCWAENPALRPTTKSLARKLWELEVKYKLLKAQQKKRKSRDAESPDKENGEIKLEDRLRKSPKLGTLAELDGGCRSPGTPRSLRSSSQELLSPGVVSRSSSVTSMSSSSSSSSNDSYAIDPRKLFTGSSRSEWAIHPAYDEHGSRLQPLRAQTDSVLDQRYGYLPPFYPNEMSGSAPSLHSLGDGTVVPDYSEHVTHDALALMHTNHPRHPGSGLQLEGLGGDHESHFSQYSHILDRSPPYASLQSSYETMNPSQWTSLPFAPTKSQNPHSSSSTMHTPLATSYGFFSPPSPSPSPFEFNSQTPIFSEVFGMGINDEPGSLFDPPAVNPVDFTTMPYGVLSPTFTDVESPFLGYTEEPSHVPNPSDTPVIASYDSFDEFDELGSDFALIGGIGVDDDVQARFKTPSTANGSSRQSSGSTVTGSSSSSSCSRQSSSGSASKRMPPTPQLSPLLSSF